mmetsp:Transcript_52822/g.57324  ORF Transcript_52822/g.57324 Transcript_52822/m.57324 type:complete len:89 (+) Transcript_52822:585-851(+)
MPSFFNSVKRKSRFITKCLCKAQVSRRIKSSSIMGNARRCKGALAPPSRYEPQLPSMDTIAFGATIQQTRNPGQRQFFVSPLTISIGS